MGKKYKNLFNGVVDINNIRDAYEKAVRGGNRYSTSHLRFKENLDVNLKNIQNSLIRESYKRGRYYQFKVYDPKERTINALPFRDRVVQHSINNIINPIFEKTFYIHSYACRKNKGVHQGVRQVQSDIRRLNKNGNVYYLKMDFSKYFKSIDKKILLIAIEKKIKDKKLMNLIKSINVDIENGIPIGNLLSQLYANIYGDIFDKFIKNKLHVKYYYRYMDDTVILSNNKNELFDIKNKLEKFIGIFMKLKFSKWQIQSINKPLNFLGYRITPKYKLVRKDSVIRAKRKIKRYKRYNDNEKLNMFLASWIGHIKSANSFNLKKFLFREYKVCRQQLKL